MSSIGAGSYQRLREDHLHAAIVLYDYNVCLKIRLGFLNATSTRQRQTPWKRVYFSIPYTYFLY